ncbi:Hypothetical predicted protein [Mytilus galloprovincialis]|uniref:Uncharacterized protein n=1 Tax=Mytilus galloprovincialis TaxID=29158 RepID=A0A8B6BYF6_MYTGA|nr:Hypothetical predicted protein [Mytilus galloprovincialis]
MYPIIRSEKNVRDILVANQTELTTAEKEEMNDTFIQIVSNYPKQLCRVKENLQRTDYDPSLPVAKKEVPFVWDEDKTKHATKQIIGRENEINSKMFDLQDNKSKGILMHF